jgi:Glycosyltransferase Maf N-terminal domain/6-hydroxymethylpterin diphosphokinase MptE-like
MRDEKGVSRSRAALLENFPQIAARIGAPGTVRTSVELENDEPIDIRVDGQRIYGGDARRFAQGQVDAYMKKPLRFTVQRLDVSGVVTSVGRKLIKTIEEGLRESRFGECSSRPTKNPTFLVVLGLGLGHHLERLVRETEARWLVVVEPFVEFLDHSCDVVDWADLVESFARRGGSIHIVNEVDPARIVAEISRIVLQRGIPYTDGSWVFTHYPFWAFNEIRDRLHEVMEHAFINRGFFEDELVMMRNAVENFAAHDFWLLEERPHLRRPEVAVVVGAGPSLDESIETLRRIRDGVVLFSAGTALRALLRNDIVPDFHCELENVPGVFDVLTETAKVGDLSQITLIAASTVDPRVAPMFGDVIFYFRDSVSSTRILAGKHREIFGTSPTCVNTAMTVGSVMGFTDFVLFGTDCGVRPGSSRHAKGTVYAEVGVFKDGNRMQGPTMELDGNFGGIVHTELVYNACRRMLIDSIRHFGLRAINCSDGAFIPGARPCVPEALEIEASTVDRGAAKSALERAMQRYRPGELLTEADFPSIRKNTEAMVADLDALLADQDEGAADFAAVYDRVIAFVAEAKNRYGRTESMISGSLQALPRIAMFYGFRVVELEGRRTLFALFITEFRAIVADMAAQIYALLDRLEAMMPEAASDLASNGGR